MLNKYTDSEAIKIIYEQLQKLKRGESSFIGFAVGVALIIDPVPLSQADIDWAVQKAKELGFIAVEAEEEYCACKNNPPVYQEFCIACGLLKLPAQQI